LIVAESPGPSSGLSFKVALVALLTLLVIAGSLYTWQIGQKALWLDECVSAIAAKGSVSETVQNVARYDAHPPLYYVLLNLTVRLTGNSEAGLRALSALASVGSVAFVYLIGAALIGRLGGLLAAAATTASAFQVYFAQEARLHALATLIALAMTWAFVRLVISPNASVRRLWKWVALYGLLTLLALYTYYYLVFVVAAHTVAGLVLWLGSWLDRRTEKPWLLTPQLAGILWPLLTVALAATGILVALGWGQVLLDRLSGASRAGASPLTLTSIIEAVRQLLLGPMVDAVELHYQRQDPPADLWFRTLSLGVGLLPWVGAALAFRRKPGVVVLWLAMVLVPFACVLWLPSRPHQFEAKHLAFVAPFLFLLVVSGRRPGWRRWAVDAMLLVLIAANIASSARYFDPNHHKEPWRAVVSALETQIQPRDVILVTPSYTEHPLRHYGSAKVRNSLITIDKMQLWRKRVLKALLQKTNGIWVVMLHSNVAAPDIGLALQLAVQCNPRLGEVPDLSEVIVAEHHHSKPSRPGTPVLGELMAHWGTDAPGKHHVALLGTLYEGFTTARSWITIHRFDLDPKPETPTDNRLAEGP
jgi:mannosyltransferase